MLQYRAVYPKTLALLKELMSLEVLQPFTLVGGTALALQLGHRISVDLDLFGLQSFDRELIIKKLNKPYQLLNQSDIFWSIAVENVKVDLLTYPYPLIRDPKQIDQIRLASIEDIGAMKLAAIANRGSKKDFFDLCVLLEKFSLADLMGFFEEKFSQEPPFYLLKSITYFEDAEDEFDPEMLVDLSWNEVKNRLADTVGNFLG